MPIFPTKNFGARQLIKGSKPAHSAGWRLGKACLNKKFIHQIVLELSVNVPFSFTLCSLQFSVRSAHRAAVFSVSPLDGYKILRSRVITKALILGRSRWLRSHQSPLDSQTAMQHQSLGRQHNFRPPPNF